MDHPARRVLVTGTRPLALGLARGLVARGDDVIVIAPERTAGRLPAPFVPCSFASESEVSAAVATARTTLGGLDQVVHTWVAPDLLVVGDLAEVTPDRWAESCEGSLDAGWWLSRTILGPLSSSSRGSAVFVVPTVGLSGAAGHAMLAAVSEGLRMLARSCGRQWAPAGVTVSTVATDPHLWLDPGPAAAATGAQSLGSPVPGAGSDPAADLAPLVALLGSDAAQVLTGATLVADGGRWTAL